MTLTGPPPLPAPESAGQDAFAPFPGHDRIRLLDSLRGFALFGILLVNMWGFKVPMMAYHPTEVYIPGSFNKIANVLIDVFASAKFLPIFSFLFGLGLVLQQGRCQATGRDFTPFLRRRMSVLLVLGLLHGILLWPGDILLIYSLFGFAAVWLLRLGPRTLCNLAALLMAGVIICVIAMSALPTDSIYEDWRSVADHWVNAYHLAGPGEMIWLRLQEWLQWWVIGLFYHIPYSLSFFLAGIAAGKSGLLPRLDSLLPRAVKHLAWAFPIGIVLSLLLPAYERGFLPSFPGNWKLLMASFLLAPALLAPAYLTGAAYVFHRGWLPHLASLLADAGRMSLSNYLFQSVAANVIFSSWGFGFYGRTSVAQGIVLSVLIFALQLFISRWWMQRYETGPVEALARRFVYGTP